MTSTTSLACGKHPLGIRPLGNVLLEDGQNFRAQGLGRLARLEDAFILQFIIEWLDVRSLVALSRVSRMLYALTSVPYIWREYYFREFGDEITHWPGSWRAVYASASCARRGWKDEACIKAAATWQVKATHVYSDALFREFMLASFDPRDFLEQHAEREHRRLQRTRKIRTDNPPEGPLLSDNLPRVDVRHTSLQTFTDTYARPGQPCILVHATDDWPCRTWSLEHIGACWGERMFQAEAMRVSGRAYMEYVRSPGGGGMSTVDAGVVPDISPSYLFDSDVAAQEPDAASGWRVPALIGQCDIGVKSEGMHRDAEERTRADLFSLLGDQRPDYRWLIAGPARSGSGWHKDPNMTSAWNAVMHGSKYWMMLPPTTPPPGVFVSRDQSEVTAPASLSEWMLDFYAETKAKHGRRECGGDGKLLEGVCHAGEVVYVPSGWWHLVINLEESVALTQNFVSVVELPAVLSFMKYTPDQISGFRTGTSKASVFETFSAQLRAHDAELAESSLAAMPIPRNREAHSQCDWRQRLCDTESATTWSLADVVEEDELGDVPWS
ncbi:hypothetical protein MNAN1_002994 [Malassezia nana]|uniref:JmjC domain-containing protein n=1 Tax=Malassezia nana TaxID=180528 RepID=A0AAF0ENH9_9BASI|nr:hypothetical protein MNAN1_002994 [Malassezia nana]